MDFQKVVDSMAAMTCVVSVEKKQEGGYGEIRIVTGNQAYIQSIEHPMGDVVMLTTKFVPNSLYTDYLTKDLNFEDFCYRAAVEKKCLHSYAHPDRFDVWFNMTFLPLTEEDGNLCYCTYTMEINQEADSSRISQISGDLASTVLETCVELRGNSDFGAAMNDVIIKLRELCSAERCCILLLDQESETCSVLCEDRAPDSALSPVSKIVDDSFYSIAAGWEKTVSGSNCLIAKNEQDMEVVRERNPEWYQSLKENRASSIILFLLKFGNKLLGYIWATNFNAENAPRIKEALELTTFILGSEINSHLLMDRLKVLSSRDMLTGVLNRNEMNNDIDRLVAASGKSVGIVFADLNGLKTVNDREGHDAGDQLLREAVCALREVFNDEEIYRAGGDEFTIIILGATEEKLARKAEQLRIAEKKYSKLSFAIGYHAEDSTANIRKALRIADEQMYEDKRIYYEKNPSARRNS
ncbi:MAG: GGDEF domain-containing protein [Clostridia bacterium]|nr:GGDEF domain-containing protein [Clostridia bacterium]